MIEESHNWKLVKNMNGKAEVGVEVVVLSPGIGERELGIEESVV